MKTLVISLLGMITIVSCGLLKNNAKKNNVALTLQIHRPYCGGAAPTAKMLEGTKSPIANENIYIQKIDGEKIKATSNQNGELTLSLKPGNYTVFKADKVELSLAAFKEKNKPKNKFYKLKSENCLQEWYAKPDFKFSVAQTDTSITLTQKAKCYVGVNNCLVYDGPIAP